MVVVAAMDVVDRSVVGMLVVGNGGCDGCAGGWRWSQTRSCYMDGAALAGAMRQALTEGWNKTAGACPRRQAPPEGSQTRSHAGDSVPSHLRPPKASTPVLARSPSVRPQPPRSALRRAFAPPESAPPLCFGGLSMDTTVLCPLVPQTMVRAAVDRLSRGTLTELADRQDTVEELMSMLLKSIVFCSHQAAQLSAWPDVVRLSLTTLRMSERGPVTATAQLLSRAIGAAPPMRSSMEGVLTTMGQVTTALAW